MVVGGASPACHPHEHQQRRSVGFGLMEKPIWVGKENKSSSPLLVFVQWALKPGFHQQHSRGVQFYGYRLCGCWWCFRCLPSARTPTTAVGGLRANRTANMGREGKKRASPLLVFVQWALKSGFHQQHSPGVQFYGYRLWCWWCLRCPNTGAGLCPVSVLLLILLKTIRRCWCSCSGL